MNKPRLFTLAKPFNLNLVLTGLLFFDFASTMFALNNSLGYETNPLFFSSLILKTFVIIYVSVLTWILPNVAQKVPDSKNKGLVLKAVTVFQLGAIIFYIVIAVNNSSVLINAIWK